MNKIKRKYDLPQHNRLHNFGMDAFVFKENGHKF